MTGHTSATADPDAARYDDAQRILTVAQATPGIPFPMISRDRATLFFLAGGPDEDEQAARDAGAILGYALAAEFTPRHTEAHGVRHDILTAGLGSGMSVDLVTRARHLGGHDTPQDAGKLTAAAA